MPRRTAQDDTDRTKTLTQDDLEAIINAVASIHGRLVGHLETMRTERIPNVRFFGGGMHARGIRVLSQFTGNLSKAIEMRISNR